MDYQLRKRLEKERQERREEIMGLIGAGLAGLAMGLPFLISGLL